MPSNTSPYSHLQEDAFWNPSVASKNALEISGLWTPKFTIEKHHTIATAGSCFAQHISKALQKRGYNWFDSEPAPATLDKAVHKDFNYGIFSFRTGNIYTVALLKQWLEWALNPKKVDEIEIWENEEGRFIDPFRPNISPKGFASKEALLGARTITFQAIKKTFETVDIFVFTLGLTEAWINTDNNCVYPMCPGTIAGKFDTEKHQFVNYQYPDIRKGLRETIKLVKEINPDIRFLLTVSPVPLTATASGKHVLTATIHSKSVLRAVAGDISDSRKDTDYFPSFEIISSFPFRGMFYQPNQRNVAPEGVDFVMKSFFEGQNSSFGEPKISEEEILKNTSPSKNDLDKLDEEICEEIFLEAFQNEKKPKIFKSDKSSICLIGTSHLGVVRQAWEKLLPHAYPDFQAAFFGAPSNGLQKVFISGDTVKSDDEKVRKSFYTTSGNLTEIFLPKYDAFILHGLGFPLKSLKAFLEKSSLDSVNQMRDVLEKELPAYFEKIINSHLIITLALAIRKASQVPIYISAAPMWSVLEREAVEDKYEIICKHGSYIKDMYWDSVTELLSANNIILIPQPEQTLEDFYFTKEEYIMGYSTNNIRDHGHMNVNYGHLVIKEILNRIEQKCFPANNEF